MDQAQYDRVCILTSILFATVAMCKLASAHKREYIWLLVVASGIVSVLMRRSRLTCNTKSFLWYADVLLAVTCIFVFFVTFTQWYFRTALFSIFLIFFVAWFTPGTPGFRLHALGHISVVLTLLTSLLLRIDSNGFMVTNRLAYATMVGILVCAICSSVIVFVIY